VPCRTALTSSTVGATTPSPTTMSGGLPVDASAEALWRDDALYDIIVCWAGMIVRFGPVSVGNFLHIARPTSRRPRDVSQWRRRTAAGAGDWADGDCGFRGLMGGCHYAHTFIRTG